MRTAATIVVLLLCTLDLSIQFDPSSYPNWNDLSSDYKIYWRIEGDDFYLALEVKTTGWIGFGLGEPTSGSMPGADIVTVSVVNGKGTATDRYALAKEMPLEDDCQDWTLLSATESDGKTIAELHRVLVPEDSTQDRPLVPGENRIIWAFGQTDTFSYHGTTNRGLRSQAFYGPPLPTPPTGDDVFYMDYLSTDYLIPDEVTTYAWTAFTLPLDKKYHMIAFDGVIQPENSQYVHHFVVHYCNTNTSRGFVETLNNTMDNGNFTDELDCLGQIYGWAPGSPTFVFPDDVGFLVGTDPGDFAYIIVGIHYDNPGLVSGVRDSSGVRIYFTSQLRNQHAAVISLGDKFVTNPDSIPPNTTRRFEYECPSACTERFEFPIHVFSSFLHMHETGKQMWTSHWRDGKLLGTTNRIDFWQFDLQQNTLVNFTIQPGDRLNTHCVYDTKNRNESTEFGPGSHDEMCIDFLTYYPRIEWLPVVCGYVHSPDFFRNVTICGTPANIGDIILAYNPAVRDPPGSDAIEFGTVSPCNASSTLVALQWLIASFSAFVFLTA